MVLNQNTIKTRVLVKLKERRMKDKVVSLLEKDCVREAFELLREKAEVEAYFPRGARLNVKPDVM